MATLSELCERQELVALGGGLDDDEQPMRLLCAFPHVIKWLDEVLPGLKTELGDGTQLPDQQVDDLFHDFVSGADLSYYERAHFMNPSAQGVWELKTSDVRLFGWFAKKAAFVIANSDTAFRCKDHNLYPGYKSDTIRRRSALSLDEPKFLIGDYDIVL